MLRDDGVCSAGDEPLMGQRGHGEGEHGLCVGLRAVYCLPAPLASLAGVGAID